MQDDTEAQISESFDLERNADDFSACELFQETNWRIEGDPYSVGNQRLEQHEIVGDDKGMPKLG
ncbi:MAG TPA: hypothetical protein VH933_07710, partial [Aestuariivirgaceae bacterium]